MKQHDPTYMRSLLVACCLAAAHPVLAQETVTQTDTTSSATATTTIGTSTTTEARLSAEFAEFLGGEEQALAVVSGLRQGTAFSLDAETGTGSTSATPTSTSIEPPSGTMGYGNVRITLKLAEAQLNQMGITQPTNAELEAVLLGGEINGTPVDGILALRADGMGWGQIAKEYGLTVGQVMGQGAGLTKQTAATSGQAKATGKAGSASTAAARANGYISSTPKSAPASPARSNGYIPSGGGKAGGAGMVTAAGGNVGSAGQGKSQAPKAGTSSAGAVSAGGQAVSASGASHAGGGNATAPGQAKKN
jgi:hypothetical protein